MKRILISGASGFLGSHIVEFLLENGYEIAALKRKSSDLWRCNSIKNADKINWIESEISSNTEKEIFDFNPDCLIHSAWGGVAASGRDSWMEQEKNISNFVWLLTVIRKTNISKIIGLGSQAEYGHFEGIVDESKSCNPNSAYGACKLSSSILLRTFAESNSIKWYWLRLFSIFGPKEDSCWLIPSTIHNTLIKKEMHLTPCEQRYDYLFVKDFSRAILSIILNNNDSGVYNLSSGISNRLVDILSYIENKIAPNSNILKFGVLPYRENQVMNMQGDSGLFYETFDFHPMYDVYEGIDATIDYFKKAYETNY